MREITASGQTVDEAIESALLQLNIKRDQADVEIIDEGKKGFLGLFGSSLAIVKVREKSYDTHTQEEPQLSQDPSIEVEKEEKYTNEATANEAIKEAELFLETVASNMDIDISIETVISENQIKFNLNGDKIGMLIGKRGKTLNALQYLTQLVLNKNTEKYLNAVVDAEGYRERRKETLEDLSIKMRDKALRLNTKVALEPMSAYERKIIHSTLQSYDDVTTYSDGQEPHRHIVVVPK